MRRSIVKFFIIILMTSTGVLSAETVQDIVQSIQKDGVYDTYFDTYINMARIKKIPEAQLLRLLKEKHEYLVFVKHNYNDFSHQMIPFILYFSDMGITQDRILLLHNQASVLLLLPIMKDFLIMMSASFAASQDDLNIVFTALCEHYTAADIKTLTDYIRQYNLKSSGRHSHQIHKLLLQHLQAGSSIKLIIRTIREVTQ